ncbi:MAG: putative Methyltransferase type 11 [Candidatus Thorarchaeota archaeon]|nr:MAG: putative Methyltransferase type 11 [Candidatus Thorarchaeota archaeon]
MQEDELGQCCADFYNHPVVRHLLDGIFHPGGVALTKMMAQKMGLGQESNVLDIACGDGMSACFLAKTLSCHITGIDVGTEMVEKAKQRALTLGVSELTAFHVSVASKLPFPTGCFSAVYSECALCTFPNKDTAVEEIMRVLKNDGVIGISDVVISDYSQLDADLKDLFGYVACIAGALSSEDYIQLFESAGCRLVDTSNHSEQLEIMANRAVGKAKMSLRISSNNAETKEKYKTALNLLDKILIQIEEGVIGYQVFIFEKISF